MTRPAPDGLPTTTDRPLIDACLAALGVPPGGGLPGLLATTSLDQFELLQTPGLWGHDPADNSYWLDPTTGDTVLPAASRRFVDAIEEVVAGAESLLDIASLEPFASGAFTAAIRRGLLARAACGGRPLTVRILYGRHGFTREGFTLQNEADFAAFITDLAADLPPDAALRIHACQMKTSAGAAPSWNHAKIIAADGRRAIVGGHNLWHEDYLAFAPVNDVSALVSGPGVFEAHAFLDYLWDWVGRNRAVGIDGTDRVIAHVVRWAGDRVEPSAPPPAVLLSRGTLGAIPALAVGRLGSGILPDPRIANVGAAVAGVAFRQARRSIRMSQMDFGFHWQGVDYWAKDVVAALADVLTDPARAVDVSLVLSEYAAATLAGGPYSFGTKPDAVAAELRRAMAGRPMTGRMLIAPVRISPHGDRWEHDGVSLKLANHAKVWIVDDRAFHVGSDNLYPHNLQEFGYVIESEPLTRDFLATYWEPLWRSSLRVAMDVF